jgi:two-component sensor histidine kinase
LIDDEKLIQKAAFGPKNPGKQIIKDPIILNIGEGICGYVAKTGVAEIINNTSRDSRYKLDDEPRLSEITVPILSEDKVIGIIDSEHTEAGFFNEQDLEILVTIASMVSIKLNQAKAKEKLNQHKIELENTVEAKTLELQKTIEELKVSNSEILQSNNEKETLLKEIHHRVKNNLQIVSSLLNLHGYKTENKHAQEVFVDCKNRIKSMSLIHEQLYGKGNLSKINAKKYITEIGQELLTSYSAPYDVNIDYDISDNYFDINVSVPFGLILNELIVNSIKYAFPSKKGRVKIDLVNENNQAVLTVSDNGIGFDSSQVKSDSLGLELIETLSEQLNGSFTCTSSANGTVSILRF